MSRNKIEKFLNVVPNYQNILPLVKNNRVQHILKDVFKDPRKKEIEAETKKLSVKAASSECKW